MSDKNKNKKPRKTYTDQFKRDAMKLLSQPGYTLAKASECNPPSKVANLKVEAPLRFL